MKSVRNWLLTTVVGVLITIGGCYTKGVTADIDEVKATSEHLKQENADRKVENAVVKKDIEDFRQSFEEFKKDVKDDLARHHSGNR